LTTSHHAVHKEKEHAGEPPKELPLGRIVLLGTSHVSAQSAKEVEEAVPTADVVAIELDAGRAQGLLSGQKATFKQLRKHLGFRTAVLAATMRWLQERIAASLDVAPGLEMKSALECAIKHNKPIALIDREVALTMHRLRSSLGWKEFVQFAKDAFRRRKIPIHPSDDFVSQILIEMKGHYPRIYAAMVSERDEHMAGVLARLAYKYRGKTIVAVVGKGHVPGIKEQIRYLNANIEVSSWSLTAKKERR
jgi:pheromone shutdown protein TraB